MILIDGVPVGDPSQISNSFDLNNIAVGQVERIEILKGAQSTFRAFVDLRNITNQQYFDVVGYNSKKFNVMTGLSFSL